MLVKITDISTELGREYVGGTVVPKNAQTTYENSDLPIGGSGHYGYPNFPDVVDIGGAFYRRGYTNRRGTTATMDCWRGGALTQHYNGCFAADLVTGAYGFPTNNIDVAAYGATAYSKLKPTKPVFSGLNAIYELREISDMLRQRFLSGPRPLASIGNYWLALKFGWGPLLKDIVSTINFQVKAQKKLKWLLENDGKPTRQRVQLVDSSTSPFQSAQIANYGCLLPVLVTQYYASQPVFVRTDWSTEKVWATGRFRFWLPSGPRDMTWKRALMAHLYGLEPTPQVIYNMIPWSWLQDWFTNAGDCLSNLDTGVADRLAADYWYCMHQTTKNIRYDARGKFFDRSGQIVELTASAFSEQFLKYRSKGDPFGFSFNPNGLSPMQLSILGALGLSRIG